LTDDAEQAFETLQGLGEIGIDLDAVTQQLEDEGIQKFAKAFNQLMNALQMKRSATVREAS